MKKIIIRIIPIILIVTIIASLLVFYGVTLSRDNDLNIHEPNLAKTAKITGAVGCKSAFDNSNMTSWNVTKKGSEAVATFSKNIDVNALVINEVGLNVTEFSVYYYDKTWQLCYKQNEIGINRIASFYTINTSKIKIVIDDFIEPVMISDIAIYNLEQRVRENELRVTTYITPNAVKEGKIDENWFDVVTDVMFIAYSRFDSEANMVESADSELEELKKLIGNRPVNILITIFHPRPELGTMAGILENYMDKAVDNVVKCVVDTDTAGADFDWEFPKNKHEWGLYSTFITKLKNKLPKGKELSIAVAPWGVQFTKEAIRSIDQLQIMTYDLFDQKGDNDSYVGSVDSNINYFLNMGFTKKQLNLGISFYGRPSDGSNVWIDYNDENFTPNEYIMFEKNVWFNSVTSVRDKTVYAILKEIGGIMTFAQYEDLPLANPLSLTASIGKAKDFFSKEATK